jgi:beta-lactamase family protein
MAPSSGLPQRPHVHRTAGQSTAVSGPVPTHRRITHCLNGMAAFGLADKDKKTYTVTAVRQLVGQGKLGLDDRLANYVDGVPRGDRIALRQMARMLHGLYNYFASLRFQQAYIAGTPPFQRPGNCSDTCSPSGGTASAGKSLPDSVTTCSCRHG